MVSGAAKRKKKAAAAAAAAQEANGGPTEPQDGGCYTGGTQASDGGRKVSPELQEKALSLGFRVDYTADKGRVCVAGRPFEPGQVIFEDEALVYGSSGGDDDDDEQDPWCLECDQPHDPQTCAVVSSLYPREVARELRRVETDLCKLDRVQTMDRARAWIKALNRVRREPLSLERMADLTAWQLEACVAAAAKARRVVPGLMAHVSNAQAGHMLSVLNTNSHELEELGGSGLFPLACLMEHSCSPNCAFSTYGTRLRVCALVPIKPGEPLAIDYGNNAYRPTLERQEDLLSTYGFMCTCQQCRLLPDRCRAFKCPATSGRCPGPVCPKGDGEDAEGWRCLSCGHKPVLEHIEAMIEHEAAALESGAGVSLVQLLMSSALHPTHYVAYAALEQRAKALVDNPSTAKEGAEAYDRVLVAAEAVLRPWEPELVVILDRAAQAHVVAGDVEGARDLYRRAHLIACRVSGQGFVPTAELAEVSDHPPVSREALLSYFARRADTLERIERRLSAASLPDAVEERARDWEGLARRLGDPEVWDHVRSKGYAVVDGVLGSGWAGAIRDEVRWLGQKGLLTKNRTQFVMADGGVGRFAKPFVEEADLHDPQLRSRVPELEALWESDVVEEVVEAGMQGAVRLKKGTQGRALKAQRNGGYGACFPWHYDNPGRPNQRAITCVLYLNPHWQPGHGGEMVLMPFLQDKVVIPPLLDRMVIFRSDSVLHRVMPSHAERFCITIWLDGLDVNKDEQVNLRVSKEEAAAVRLLAERLVSCPSQRVLSRAVYDEEYGESLRQCMEGAEGGEEMVQAHKAHLAQVSGNAFMSSLVDGLKQLKPATTDRQP